MEQPRCYSVAVLAGAALARRSTVASLASLGLACPIRRHRRAWMAAEAKDAEILIMPFAAPIAHYNAVVAEKPMTKSARTSGRLAAILTERSGSSWYVARRHAEVLPAQVIAPGGMARVFPSPRLRESLALVPRYVLGVSFASSLLTLQVFHGLSEH